MALLRHAVASLLLVGLVLAEEPGEGKDTVKLTKDNFDEEVVQSGDFWLVEFFAPWCGHCKNIAPEWAKAATALKGKAKLGTVDATVETDLAKMFDVSGYPTIIQFPYGNKTDEEGIFKESYGGPREADGIVEYVEVELEKVGIDISEIKEVTGKESLEENCLNKKYCVVFLLPHVIDTGAKGRNDYIAIAKEVSKTMGRSNPASYMWLQGGNQMDFEQAFDANAGYPAMVAINKDRKRFGNHKGAFTAAALVKTLRSMQSGHLPTTAYKNFPDLETTEPWDGKDYVAPEEDEEY